MLTSGLARWGVMGIAGAMIINFTELVMAAPPAQWKSVGVGGGGALFSPSFSPHAPDELFIACDMSELFHSTNLGAAWAPVDFREIQGNRATRVQFTNNPQILYAIDHSPQNLIDGGWPSKSTDGGQTWTILSGDPTDGGCFALFADPADANRVLCNDYTRLYWSSNGGTSFDLRTTYNPSGAGLYIAGAFFDGQNIFLGTNGGLLVSTNGGDSFTFDGTSGLPAGDGMASFAGAKEGGTVRLFALMADQGDLYNGLTVEDLFWPHHDVYTLDWGSGTWTAKNTGLPTGDGNGLAHIACALNDIDIAWVAGQDPNENPIIYRTTNAGDNWASVLTINNNQNAATGWAGWQGDRGWTYGAGATGFTVAPNDSARAAYTDYGFCHLTTDGGASWRQAYLDPADQNSPGAPTPKGKAYRGVGFENTSCWWLCWSDADNIFAGFSDIRGIRSTDSGEKWSFNYTGHTENSAYCILRHAASGTLYMATSTAHDIYQSTYLTDARLDGADGRVMMSGDGGATWQQMHDFNNPVIYLALDANNTNRLYASVIDSATGGIFVTNNRQDGASATWSALADPPRTEGHPFNIHVLNDGALVCTYSGRRTGSGFTASSGVFYSTNGGTSWDDRSHSGMLYWTKDIVIDPHDATQQTWYACVFSGWGGPPNGLGGLYKTTNRGQNWTRILDSDRVGSGAINPANPNEMYVTTEIEGLWYCENLTAPAPAFSQVAGFPFRQPERVFYNPHKAGEVWVTSFGGGIRIGETAAPLAISGFWMH